MIAITQCVLRYALLLPILGHYGIDPVLTDFRFALVVISTVLLAASGYIINDYFDLRIDRINKPGKVVIGRLIKRRQALFLHVLLTFTGILMGLFIAYVSRKESYALMYVAIPIILWYYSTTFKRHIVIGNLIISFLTGLVAILVVSVEFAMLSRVHGLAILRTQACSIAWFWTGGFALFAFLTNFIREIIKDTEDIKGDKAVGCRTLPIALGLPLTKLFVFLLQLTSLVALWLIYFFIPQVSELPYALLYFIVAFTVPHIGLMITWVRSKKPQEFHRASTINKLIMLLGIVFMVWVGWMF